MSGTDDQALTFVAGSLRAGEAFGELAGPLLLAAAALVLLLSAGALILAARWSHGARESLAAVERKIALLR